MADQLVTKAQVKARLGIVDAGDDAVLDEMIEQATALIEGYTGRKFVPETAATYVMSTNSGYSLSVPRGIRTITSIGIATQAHQPDSGGTYTALAASDYLLRPSSMARPEGWPATEIRLSRATSLAFSTIENGVRIVGDFGFAAVPLDIQAVCIDMVAAAYSVRKNPSSGFVGPEGYAVPAYTSFFGKNSPQRSTLDRYRYLAVA